ncbi:MAG TPA: flagellar hook-basal body complex protein FliE [Acidimicrobiales bacterium]|nr:flagellar hook-basal body complex protein FliE [Acidimicrobiales bacterium]
MITPIGTIPPITSAGISGSGTAAGTGIGATGSPAGASGSNSFGNVITNAIDSVNQVQASASTQAAQVAAGQGNVADALIASTQASLATQVTTAVTNKAIEAFTQVMNMQL